MPQGGSISDETADYIVQLDGGTDFAVPRLKETLRTGGLQRKKKESLQGSWMKLLSNFLSMKR